MKLGDIAEACGLGCQGDAETEISGIASLPEAGPGQLAFLFSPAYRAHLGATAASAVVLRAQDAADCRLPCLLSDSPRLAWARIAALFDKAPKPVPGVHSTAVVAASAQLGKDVALGAHTVVSGDAVLEEGVAVGPGCFIGEGSRIGKGTRLHANVTLYHDVALGEACIVHAGVVIGADGFGYEYDGDSGEFVKIPQVYGVRIGRGVEIGAGSAIDRGALNHTALGDHCKLDNLVQIGHGARVGEHTVISGCSALAGSVVVGSRCLIGGGAGVVDNVRIADRVEVTARTLVTRSITEPGRYSSGTAMMPSHAWKRSAVGFAQLDGILKRIKQLEKNKRWK